MRKEMRQESVADVQKARIAEQLSDRNGYADRLTEKWMKTQGVGEGLLELANKDIGRARALSITLENEEKHLTQLTETQISNSFSTTPQNVLRIVRLGYPNSVRGEIFLEWAMETARDSIYYLSPVYQASKRGATAGNVTHENASFRYASEIESEVMGTGDGSTVAFTGPSVGKLTNPPLRPFSVKVLAGGTPVAVDDGSGNLIGVLLNTSATNTVNYDDGAITVTFTTAPTAGAALTVEYNFDSEDVNQYPDLGSIDIQLRDYQFRVKPWPLYVSWSKMTELLINTTLNIDAEDALIRGAADELKKSLDFHAIRLAYQSALRNSAVTFNTQGAVGEAEVDRVMAFSRAIDGATNKMYNVLQRGGVTKLVGGPTAVGYLQLHSPFNASNAQQSVGAYRVGSIDDIDVYKVPSSIVPDDEFMAVYRNENVPEDVSVAFGTLVPLYRSQTLEYKEFYSETGLAYFGDSKVLQPNYLQRIKLLNL